MNELLNMGIIPIVNENDTLSVAVSTMQDHSDPSHTTKEIKFGDNDTLSAITAAMLSADYLFLMTDVDCLYTENPRANPLATPITVVPDISALEADVSSAGSALGTGGMSTKIVAAKLATSAGVTTIITRSSKPGNVAEIVSHLETLKHAARIPGDPDGTIDPPAAETSVTSLPLHTRFLPSQAPIRDRSFWLLHGLAPHGTVYIDEGAYRALRRKAGLLPAGVVGVEGHFSQQEAVRLVVMSSSRAETSALQSDPHLRSPTSSQPSSRPPTRTSTHGGLAAYDHPSIESDMTSSTNSSSTAIATPTHSSSIPEKPSSRPASGADLQTLLNSTVLANAHAHTHGYPPSTATMPQREVGRALVNYAAPEVARIKGLQSADIASVLGYADSEYVALRENVSLFSGKDRERGGRTGDGHDEAPEREDQVPPKLGDLGSFA